MDELSSEQIQQIKRKRKLSEDDEARVGQPSTKVFGGSSSPQPQDVLEASLLHLSDEILLEIFRNVDSESLISVSKTCQRLNSVARDKQLWIHSDFTTSSQSASDILKDIPFLGKETKTLKIRGHVSSYPLDKWKNCTVTQNILELISDRCPNLQSFEIHEAYLDTGKISITQFPTTLKHLVFRKCEVDERKRFDRMSAVGFLQKIDKTLQLLEDLTIEDCSWFDTHDFMAMSKIPNLRKLNLKGCKNLKESVPYASIAARFGFKKLESLDLRDTPISDADITCFNITYTLKELLLECPENLRNMETANVNPTPPGRGRLRVNFNFAVNEPVAQQQQDEQEHNEQEDDEDVELNELPEEDQENEDENNEENEEVNHVIHVMHQNIFHRQNINENRPPPPPPPPPQEPDPEEEGHPRDFIRINQNENRFHALRRHYDAARLYHDGDENAQPERVAENEPPPLPPHGDRNLPFVRLVRLPRPIPQEEPNENAHQEQANNEGGAAQQNEDFQVRVVVQGPRMMPHVIVVRGVDMNQGGEGAENLRPGANHFYRYILGHGNGNGNAEPQIMLVSDRGICSYGISRNFGADGIIFIRCENRPAVTSLEKLIVRHYKRVTDTSLRHLETAAPNLKLLDVTGTSVTIEGVRSFKLAKPNCIIVSNFDATIVTSVEEVF